MGSEVTYNNSYIAEWGKYLSIAGTSMAAPVVTGIVAQFLEQNPKLTVSQLREKLIKYAENYSPYKTDAGNWDPAYGYGLATVNGIFMETAAGETIQLSVKNNIFKPSASTDQQFNFLVKSKDLNVNEIVDIKIFTGRGGLVKTYSPQTISGVGVMEYEWNGQDDSGIPVPAGLYFILAQVGNNTHRYPVLVVE